MVSTEDEETERAYQHFIDLVKQQSERQTALEKVEESYQTIKSVRQKLIHLLGYDSEKEYELSRRNRHRPRLIWANIDWGYSDQFTPKAIGRKFVKLALWVIWIALGVMLYRIHITKGADEFMLIWLVAWCGLAGWARHYMRH